MTHLCVYKCVGRFSPYFLLLTFASFKNSNIVHCKGQNIELAAYFDFLNEAKTASFFKYRSDFQKQNKTKK